jgi:hypothetical protein
LDGGPPGFPRDYTCPVVLEMGVTRAWLTRTGLSPALVRHPSRFRFHPAPRRNQCTGSRHVSQPQPRNACTLGHVTGLACSPFRSPLLRAGYYFLRVLRCFSSPGALSPSGVPIQQIGGLPHSETRRSRPGCGSLLLSLLACVLHRLVVPRHPPTAHHVLPGLWFLGSTTTQLLCAR